MVHETRAGRCQQQPEVEEKEARCKPAPCPRRNPPPAVCREHATQPPSPPVVRGLDPRIQRRAGLLREAGLPGQARQIRRCVWVMRRRRGDARQRSRSRNWMRGVNPRRARDATRRRPFAENTPSGRPLPSSCAGLTRVSSGGRWTSRLAGLPGQARQGRRCVWFMRRGRGAPGNGRGQGVGGAV